MNKILEETWINIEDFPYYQVSNQGSVRSLDRVTTNSVGTSRKYKGKKLTPFKNSTGYYYVTLCDGNRRCNRRVHSLVARAFLPNTLNKRTINHKNGDKSDNRVCNLEWATDSENHTHAYKIDLKGLNGIAKRYRKLTDTQVLEIKKQIEQGELTKKQIGETYSVCRTAISDIKLGKRFKKVARRL